MLVVDKCKAKKEKLHYTYAQISEISGIPLSTINAFFNESVQNPSYITVGAICKALGISLDSILGIVDEEMSAVEIARVREESAKNEERLQQTIQTHAQNIMLNEATIANNQEIIRRQDLRMAEQNTTIEGLKDRIQYQKKAITIHRALIFAFAAYGVIVTVFLFLGGAG